jgi:predicted phage terminase large subunit-like protein
MKLVEAIRNDFDPRLLDYSEGRRLLTRNDPLLFAAVYMPHKLKTPASEDITLNQFHLDICEYAKQWIEPLGKPAAHRDVFIAPRSCGKSTWIFHILPIWAAAHSHKKYIVAFSDSEDQAIGWLRNFKMELDSNELLRQDYPDLCDTYKKSESSKAYMDNRNATQRGNGFVFQAKGVDSAILGANIGGTRPEVILFDDIEPPEANYGATELKKRKQTILTTHFYLNLHAIVAFVGTTTMAGSLIDQMRKVGEAWEDFEGDPDTFKGTLDPELQWVVNENIVSHYYPAVVVDDEGNESSLWPEVWNLDDWTEIRGTREFAMNMMNKPISGDEGYWTDSDINLDRAEYGTTVLSIDPAVTTSRRADYSAFAVMSRGADRKLYLRHVEQIKGDSEALRAKAKELVEKFGIGIVLVETNQGGGLWQQVFKDIGARVRFLHQKIKKEYRIAQSADFYKAGKVVHTAHFPQLEEQMLAYPNVLHDDLVDSVATAVLYFEKNKGRRVTATQLRYTDV